MLKTETAADHPHGRGTDQCVRRAQDRMSQEGFSALIVYGNTKVEGSYRYLSGNASRSLKMGLTGSSRSGGDLLRRGGSRGSTDRRPGAALGTGSDVRSAPVSRRCPWRWVRWWDCRTHPTRGVRRLHERARDRVGIETWDRFPPRSTLASPSSRPECEFAQSTVIEQLRMDKIPIRAGVVASGRRDR